MSCWGEDFEIFGASLHKWGSFLIVPFHCPTHKQWDRWDKRDDFPSIRTQWHCSFSRRGDRFLVNKSHNTNIAYDYSQAILMNM